MSWARLEDLVSSLHAVMAKNERALTVIAADKDRIDEAIKEKQRIFKGTNRSEPKDAIAQLGRAGEELENAATATAECNTALYEYITLVLGASGWTRPSFPPGQNRPRKGTVTEADPTSPADRGKRRENEVAELLHKRGYDIEQNPPGKTNGKNPDFVIKDRGRKKRYWDCYAPESNNPRLIRDGIKKKVDDEQADRIVLDMRDARPSFKKVRAQLERNPIVGLKEVILIRKGGRVSYLYPWQQD